MLKLADILRLQFTCNKNYVGEEKKHELLSPTLAPDLSILDMLLIDYITNNVRKTLRKNPGN